ncbi:MAG: membrane-binding protein [Saprospiraceae bacterium]|nr:membrane-binding protein [Saprospiraceae bacterium]
MDRREAVYATIPDTCTLKSDLHYDRSTSTWLKAEHSYSGYALDYHDNGRLRSSVGIHQGRRENVCIEWFGNGKIRSITHYRNGKLHGIKKTWSSDEPQNLLSYTRYASGKAHGTHKIWYPSGEIFKILHYEHGIEKGLQQAFRKNGDLFANYEARDGRVYGLKRASLCFGLSSESIDYEN